MMLSSIPALFLMILLTAGHISAAPPVNKPVDTGVRVEKFTISRDDSVYECFPSLTRLKNGRIILTYRESNGHKPSEFCRIIVRTSDDGGKTFSDRQVIVDVKKTDGVLQGYNCPKVQQLKDGRVLLLCDTLQIPPWETRDNCKTAHNVFWFSSDNGDTWSKPVHTSVKGIMPDEVVELDNGDWLLATHFYNQETGFLMQCVSRSTDGGKTWGEPEVVASKKGYNYCEASILKLPKGQLVCYMRENSGKGYPIYKSISTDNGKTWKGPYDTQMECGHRPVAHLTKSGKVLITYRHQIGGKSPWAKNIFAFLESVESALEPDRSNQNGILLPLDHDRSSKSDCGYTGWVETEPGKFFAVTYINDDAPKAYIRGYRFSESDF